VALGLAGAEREGLVGAAGADGKGAERLEAELLDRHLGDRGEIAVRFGYDGVVGYAEDAPEALDSRGGVGVDAEQDAAVLVLDPEGAQAGQVGAEDSVSLWRKKLRLPPFSHIS